MLSNISNKVTNGYCKIMNAIDIEHITTMGSINRAIQRTGKYADFLECVVASIVGVTCFTIFHPLVHQISLLAIELIGKNLISSTTFTDWTATYLSTIVISSTLIAVSQAVFVVKYCVRKFSLEVARSARVEIETALINELQNPANQTTMLLMM